MCPMYGSCSSFSINLLSPEFKAMFLSLQRCSSLHIRSSWLENASAMVFLSPKTRISSWIFFTPANPSSCSSSLRWKSTDAGGYSKRHPLPTVAPERCRKKYLGDLTHRQALRARIHCEHHTYWILWHLRLRPRVPQPWVLGVEPSVVPCSILLGQYILEDRHSACVWLLKLTSTLMARLWLR